MIEEIFANIDRYQYFQALKLLRIGTGDISGQWMRLYPAANISFPGSEIRHSSMDQEGRLCLHMNFMGLYGVDAPVPLYMSDYIAGESPGSRCLESFLGFLGARFYELLFDGWVKYHPYQMYHESATRKRHEALIASISGVRGQAIPGDLLVYASLLGSTHKGVVNLERMISSLLDGADCEIEEYVERWQVADNPSQIGSDDCRLGDNIILGERLLDACGSIRVIIGPLDIDHAIAITHDSNKLQAIGILVEQMTNGSIDHQLEILCDADCHVTSLGDDTACLGRSAILGLADDYIRISLVSGHLSRSPS